MITGEEQYRSRFFFLPGTRGQLFATFRQPASGQKCTAAVLCVMPMAEEMNRCRRLAAVQSSALAQNGVSVLCVDLYGCGDSEGEFEDADWGDWLEDLRYARSWLESETGLNAVVWAIRQGALLAAAAFCDSEPGHVLLWQPVASGSTALSEMLRVSVASNLIGGGDKSSTVEGLRAAVLGGKAVEVGGYSITPDIARALDAASLDPWPFNDSIVDWLDIEPEGSKPTAARRSAAFEAVTPGSGNGKIRHQWVPGRRFWSSPDVFASDHLTDATLKIFGVQPVR